MTEKLTRRAFAEAGTVAALTFGGLAVVEPSLAQSPGLAIKAGLIGLDTSHVPETIQALSHAKPGGPLDGVKVVAAFPGGTRDNPHSWSRLRQFTESTRKSGVEIVDSIDALLKKVDAVILTSVDGRAHLEQVKPVIAAGKPVYIDKPLAGTLADAVAIFRLAQKSRVPCFSSSSLRYSPDIIALTDPAKVGKVLGCEAHSPCALEEHHPDLYWYGIHGVEILYTIMGGGCQSVSRVHTTGTDVAVGVWKDGRVGSFRGLRDGKPDYGATVYGSKGNAAGGKYNGHEPIVVQIVKFFKTGKSPVPAEETLEIYAFMEAADESKRQGGRPVSLRSVMEKADAAAG
jgi:predicted dehydrogenase